MSENRGKVKVKVRGYKLNFEALTVLFAGNRTIKETFEKKNIILSERTVKGNSGPSKTNKIAIFCIETNNSKLKFERFVFLYAKI